MTAREWVKEHYHEYHDRTELCKACMEALGKHPSVIRRAINNLNITYPSGLIKGPVARATEDPEQGDPSDIIAPKEFLQDVDIISRIDNFLNKTVKNSYIPDEKLRQRFNIGKERWKEIRSTPIFLARQFTYSDLDNRKNTVWSSEYGVEQAKQAISMSRYDG